MFQAYVGKVINFIHGGEHHEIKVEEIKSTPHGNTLIGGWCKDENYHIFWSDKLESDIVTIH
jgi:hypothetical protein